MPATARYFFHLVSEREVIPDEEGVDLLADEDVLLHIARAVDELIQEAHSSSEWQGWWLEITDSAGRTVLNIPLTSSDQATDCLLCPVLGHGH